VSPGLRPFLWLGPLAFVTLWVWLEVLLGWWQRRHLQDVREWRARLADTRGAMPCLFCHNVRHSWEEHVRYPQKELLMRDEDELWRLEHGGGRHDA
jgi:hypothetical protein